MAQVVFEMNIEELQTKLENMVEGEIRQALSRMAIEYREEVMRNFDMQGRDESGRTGTWTPLKPSTVKQRERYKGAGYGTRPILERTGALKQSIQPKTWTGELAFGVTVGEKYGVYHQTGTSKMPARPFLNVPIEIIKEIIIENLKG